MGQRSRNLISFNIKGLSETEYLVITTRFDRILGGGGKHKILEMCSVVSLAQVDRNCSSVLNKTALLPESDMTPII